MSVENKVFIPKQDEITNDQVSKKPVTPGTNCATSQVSSAEKKHSSTHESDLKELIMRMVKLIKKEFNCNHEADLNGK